MRVLRGSPRKGNLCKLPSDKSLIPWIAGLIDADGTINFYKRSKAKVNHRPWYDVRIRVTNSCSEIMEFLVENFGGKVYNTPTPTALGKKSITRWEVWRKADIALLIHKIFPYLIHPKKRERAKKIIDWLSQVGL